ncbi:glycosyltransferase family 92 protein RCOM_0530710-like [Silene latifolia]|uniref:glycosyltransferase family 92 protein RCOM_0530710-like n=1 Tax=Silene latifolia TaxID=37657 RepID=UPI003D789677
MYRKYTSIRISLIILLAIVLFGTLSHHFHRTAIQTTPLSTAVHSLSTAPPPPPPPPPPIITSPPPSTLVSLSTSSPKTISILIPDWEVLVIADNPTLIIGNYTCVFPNKATSPARLAGELPFRRETAFKCEFPARNRRRLPFLQPQLVLMEGRDLGEVNPPLIELLRWNFIVYDSFKTEDDVVLLVKGVNNRQGINRPPSDFNCVFGDDVLTAVKVPVTSSVQEIFRCPRPGLTGDSPVSATLEILENNRTVAMIPSLVKYVPDRRRTVEFNESKSLICACTMVYNVAKFLREWVMYHNNIGLDRFILYDNDSNDNLRFVVDELNREGYDVRTVYWAWPKTQEAGFSHCALYSNQLCDWVAFLDVDEFIFSPMWLDSPQPKGDMLKSMLPKNPHNPIDRVGQVTIRCNEFGPSNLTAHPLDGVTQGYTCRRRVDQRHKSIVLLDAVDHSLLNVVHHFKIKDGYRSSQVDSNQAIVNHYKYQAWPEFQAKFRRRVSAYVIDWRQKLNLMSNDRAPGLGSEAVEPSGWAQRFCEVHDDRMKVLTRTWFGLNDTGVMAWQSA